MEERYLASVDLGSYKVALTVAKVQGEDVEILYYKQKPSDGIRYSAVYNPKKASDAIRVLIRDAEEELKIRILQVVVGLPRCDVRQETNSAVVDRVNPDENITTEEIETLKFMAQSGYPLSDPDKEQLYGAVAQSYSTEEEFQLIEDDIIGMVPEHLEGNFKLFIGKKSSVRNIDKVFNSLDIAIAAKYFTPGTTARAVLKSDEMQSGVALIDFGGGATSVTIYHKQIMRYYGAIPFGGDVITADIQNECSISRHLAENIKLAWGACQPDRLASLEEKIIQIEDEELGYKQIPVKYLSEIITARTKEIIEAILYHIERSGLADDLRSGIVITGGGAELANILSYIKELSGFNARKGLPRHLFSASGCQGAKETGAAPSIGMILAAKEDIALNCIDPVMEDEEEETADAGRQESYSDYGSDTPYDTTRTEEEEEVSHTPYRRQSSNPLLQGEGEGASIEDEDNSGNLFSDDEVPVTEKPGRRGRKKDKGPKKESLLKIKWKTLAGKIYDTITEEDTSDEDM